MDRWRNRITGTGEEAPDQLLANPRNWRIHPQHQQDALAGVLDEVGWVQQVIVNQRTGHLVDGHLRVSLAERRGESSVPVVYVDLSETEEAEILATLDPLAGLAVADNEKLSELLEDVSTADAAVMEMLGELAPVDVLENPDATLGGQNYFDTQAKTGYFGVGECGAPVDYALLKEAEAAVQARADETSMTEALEVALRLVRDG
jgi:hypothetical protein